MFTDSLYYRTITKSDTGQYLSMDLVDYLRLVRLIMLVLNTTKVYFACQGDEKLAGKLQFCLELKQGIVQLDRLRIPHPKC